MTQKHTPGPWLLSQVEGAQPGEQPLVIDSDGYTICHTDQTRNEENNARLIAAAPDLLEALKKTINDAANEIGAHLTGCGPNAEPTKHDIAEAMRQQRIIIDAVRAAISKAESK